MSRQKIVRAVEAAGWTLDYLEWEPIGIIMEKSGPTGGWDGMASHPTEDREAQIMGYNWQQAVAWFENEASGVWVDPFSCARKSSGLKPGDCTAALGHKGPHFPYHATRAFPMTDTTAPRTAAG